MDNGASGDASFRSAVVTNNGQSIVAPFRGATSPGADADTFKRYDAFLSYSWKADAEFARILQHALHRFAKPWWQLRAVRLFRDKENEDVGRGLTSTLQHALAASEYLILLASPAAARSHWVGEEIAYWRQHRAIDKLLIVVTSGTVRWDAARGDFDWEATTALPASLFGAFAEEPLWIDFTSGMTAHGAAGTPEFRDLVGTLSARIRGIPKADLTGIDVLLQRRARRLRTLALLVISTLALVASVTAMWALRQRNEALRSQSRFLANAANQQLAAGYTGLAVRLALAALPEEGLLPGFLRAPWTPEAEGALSRAVDRNRERLILRHRDNTVDARFSPDGSVVVTASWDGTAVIWNPRTGNPIHQLRTHQGRVLSISFSPDGRMLATASADGTARLWDAASGQQVAVLVHPHPVATAMFTRDGERLVTSAGVFSRSPIMVWDAASRAVVAEIANGATFLAVSPECDLLFTQTVPPSPRLIASRLPRTTGDIGVQWNLPPAGEVDAVSPDCTRVVLSSRQVSGLPPAVIELSTGRTVAVVGERGEGLDSAAFNPAGTRLVTGLASGQARLWDVQVPRLIATLEGHTNMVASAAFSSDGARIVTASHDGTARLWDSRTGETLAVLSRHAGLISHVAFSPDRNRVVTAGLDATARIWDASLPREVVLETPDGRPNHFGSSANGERLATVHENGWLRVWSTTDGRQLHAVKLPLQHVSAVAFAEARRFLAVAETQGAISVHDIETGAERASLRDGGGDIVALGISADGQQVVSGSGDGTLRRWNIADGTSHSILRGHSDLVTSIRFTPDGQRLVTAAADGTARIWNTRRWDVQHVLSLRRATLGLVAEAVPPRDAARLSLLPNAGVWVRHIVSPSQAVTAGIEAGDVLLQWDEDPLTAASYAEKMKALRAGTRVKLLVARPAGRHVVLAVAGEDSPLVTIAAIDARGRRIVVADKEVAEIWDTVGGTRVTRLIGHEAYIRAATFTPDGRRVVTAGGNDNTARVWDAESGLELKTFKHLAQVNDVQVDNSGLRILSASFTIGAMFMTETAEPAAVFTGHTANVESILLSPTQNQAATMSADGTVRFWPLLPTGRALKNLAALQVSQPLTTEELQRFFLTAGPE